MRAWTLSVLLMLVALSGCLGGGTEDRGPPETEPMDYSHLDAPGADVTRTAQTQSFHWEGQAEPGLAVPVVGTSGEPTLHEFQVDETVGYMEAKVHHFGANPVQVTVLDDEDRVACAVRADEAVEWCTALVPWHLNATVTYTATVTLASSGLTPSVNAETIPYELNVTLHPRSHIPMPDIEAQLDPGFVFRNQDTGFDSGEPTLGVTSDGDIFTVMGTSTLRSTDDGQTWDDVTPPLTTTSLDPMLWVDPWTDRVFTDHLYVACSYLSWSDDDGESWITNPAACGMTANDHQKVTTGGHFAPTPLYDGIVYYSFNSFSLVVPGGGMLWVSRSLDGGLTWQPAVAVTESLDYSYRTGGHIVADRQGNVYVPMYLTDENFGVAVSHDHGATWNAVRAGEGGLGSEGIDPGLTVDVDGNVYGGYLSHQGVRVVTSTDHGETWTDSQTVSPPGLQSFVLADAVAGDPGRVAVAYLATAESDRGPNRADGYTRWHLYVSLSENALDENANWTTTRVTPADDPVQIGSICTAGVGCFGGNRNLLDFIDIQAGPDGRMYVAYTDGCLDECITPQTSRSDQGYVAVQDQGPRLFAEKAPWAQ